MFLKCERSFEGISELIRFLHRIFYYLNLFLSFVKLLQLSTVYNDLKSGQLKKMPVTT